MLLHIFTNIFVTVVIFCLEGYVVNSKATGNIEHYFTGAASLPDDKTCFILPSRCLSYTSLRTYRGNQVMMFLNVKFSSDGVMDSVLSVHCVFRKINAKSYQYFSIVWIWVETIFKNKFDNSKLFRFFWSLLLLITIEYLGDSNLSFLGN